MNNYVIIQNGVFYYTNRNKIEWKKCNDEILDFELDKKSGRMFAVNKDLQIGEINKFFEFTLLNQKALADKPINIEVVDNSVFALVPNYIDIIAKDKARETYGNLTVIEKNYKRIDGYKIYFIDSSNFKEIFLKGEL